MAELTDEQIAAEERFLEGIPRWNIGALFLPPIWGPAHGFWVTILFYPLWLFADNSFYAAYSQRTTLSMVLAVVVGVVLVAVTFLFARLSHRLLRIGRWRAACRRRRTCAASAFGPWCAW